MKLVINIDFGGFHLSKEAIKLYAKKKGIDPSTVSGWDVPRADPALVSTIEELGSNKSSTGMSSLRVIEIPDDVDWQIQDYDGKEWVVEKHRAWYYSGD